jgi:hypothetical protein
MSWHPDPETLYDGHLESQVIAQDHQEERDARRDSGWPDDDGRPDPSEYAPNYLAFSLRLGCGHTVEASEDSGGFDEVPRVTEKMVRDLLAFKIRVHNCELTENRIRVQQDAAGSPGIGADGGPF